MERAAVGGAALDAVADAGSKLDVVLILMILAPCCLKLCGARCEDNSVVSTACCLHSRNRGPVDLMYVVSARSARDAEHVCKSLIVCQMRAGCCGSAAIGASLRKLSSLPKLGALAFCELPNNSVRTDEDT